MTMQSATDIHAKSPPEVGTEPAIADVYMVHTPDGGDATLNVFGSEGNFVAGLRMGRALAASTLVPDSYQNNLPNVMIAMEAANRIGASVFAVMQNLDIIHGRPSWRATFLIATVNACGRFTPLRFRFFGERGTMSWGCVAVAKDIDSGEECMGPDVTLQIAKDEGWYDRKGTKWRTLPQLMLMYRAAAFWSRVYAPELSLGMRTAEESEDISPREVLNTGETAARAKALQASLMTIEAKAEPAVAKGGPKAAPETLPAPPSAPPPAKAQEAAAPAKREVVNLETGEVSPEDEPSDNELTAGNR